MCHIFEGGGGAPSLEDLVAFGPDAFAICNACCSSIASCLVCRDYGVRVRGWGLGVRGCGYLAHKNPPHQPRTTIWPCTYATLHSRGEGASYERGTPCNVTMPQKCLYWNAPALSKTDGVATRHVYEPYRCTSLIRNSPPSWDYHRALGIVLL